MCSTLPQNFTQGKKGWLPIDLLSYDLLLPDGTIISSAVQARFQSANETGGYEIALPLIASTPSPLRLDIKGLAFKRRIHPSYTTTRYSYEDRIKAIKLYIKYDRSAADTIRELGYPSRSMLARWYKEYLEQGDLHEQFKRAANIH